MTRPDFSSMRNLTDLQEYSFSCRSEYTQFIDQGKEFSNHEIYHISNIVAGFLQNKGFGRGDKIAVCTKIQAEAFAIIPGVWRSGSTVVSIHNKLGVPQICEILKITQSSVLFVDHDRWDSIAESVKSIETLKQVVIVGEEREACIALSSLLNIEAVNYESPAQKDDVGLILFSSGSTGQPKGIRLTHKMMLAEVEAFYRQVERQEDPEYLFLYTKPARVMFNTPLGHVAGTMALTLNLAAGNSYILQDVFEVEALFAAIQKYKAEALFFGPPTVYAALLASPEVGKYDLSSMRFWSTGGSPITYEKVKQLKQTFPGTFGYVYGLTESSGISTLTNFDDNYVMDSVGKPLPGIEVQIRTSNGQQVPVGETGEVCIKGDTISPGYLNLEEENRRTFKNGWLHTGDLGRMDQEGNLFVLGRVKHLIRQAGVNIFPRTIEVVLESLPEVKECAVVGMADEVLGERVVAYVVMNSGSTLSMADLKKICRDKLAKYEVPRHFYFIDKMPRTGSNKIDLALLKKGYQSTVSSKETPSAPQPKSVEKRMVLAETLRKICEQMGFHDIQSDVPLMQSGFDSLAAVEFSILVSESVGHRVPEILIFNHPTLNDVVEFLISEKNEVSQEQVSLPATPSVEISDDPNAVAIIGASCRLPGGIENLEDLWDKLKTQTDCLSSVPKERWDTDELHSTTAHVEGKVAQKRGGFIRSVGLHDPHFFDLSNSEARVMDPQQRLVHQMAWEALESSLIRHKQLSEGTTGVYIGISSYDYCHLAFGSGRSRPDYAVGMLPPFIAGRLSHWMNLNGPSLVVDTACSSGLVAMHLAYQAIKSGECDFAFAGGVSVMTVPMYSQIMSMMGVLAPDGYCKTFDSSANGTVRSEGGGIVLLKKLSQALKDGDKILGVIRGSSVSHDARSTGVAAPNGASQIKVIRAALKSAQLKPDQISYIEAHGTGTVLGDAIELNSIHEGYQSDKNRKGPLYVGSVKTNIGHTEAAAGAAGVIKVLMSFKKSTIPPHMLFKNPNKNFDWTGSQIQVPDYQTPWPQQRQIAGINSFGVTGTNAHMIVEEPPEQYKNRKPNNQLSVDQDRGFHILTLSAKSEKSLKALASRYIQMLDENPTINLGNLCYTANTRRSHFGMRKAIVFQRAAQLREQLVGIASSQQKIPVSKKPSKLGFLFTGQGGAAVGMGLHLIKTNSVFRNAVEQCNEILRPLLGKTFQDIVSLSAGASEVLNVRYTQAAVSTLQFAMTEMLKSWGLTPTHVLGHSGGEFMAASVSGALEYKDALTIAIERSLLMSQLPADHLMAVCWGPLADVELALKEANLKVSIASFSAPECFTLVGQKREIAEIISLLNQKGIKCKSLDAASEGIGFHSSWVDPILADFEKKCQKIKTFRPQIRYFSSLLGRQLSENEKVDGNYWCQLTRQPVQYSEALKALHTDGVKIFVEIGPSTTLTAMGPMNTKNPDLIWRNSLNSSEDNWFSVLNLLKTVYENGFSIDWETLDSDFPRDCVDLPLYPFDFVDLGLHPFDTKKVPAPQIIAAPAAPKVVETETKKENHLAASRVREALLSIIGEMSVSKEKISLNSSLADLGFDSVKFVQLALDMEEKLELSIDLTQVPVSAEATVLDLEESVLKLLAQGVQEKNVGTATVSTPIPSPVKTAVSGKPVVAKMRQTLIDIIVNNTGVSSELISDETNLYELGVDSIKFIQLALDIEEKLKVNLDFSSLDLSTKSTFLDLQRLIEGLSGVGPAQDSPQKLQGWLANPVRSSQAEMQLICFHHLGGGASLFQKWSSSLGPGIEVLPIQLPGREERLSEKPYLSFDEVVNDLTEFLPTIITKPFAIYGHSLGGGIGAAVATKLKEKKGLMAQHLFISGLRAPSTWAAAGPLFKEPISEKNIASYIDLPEKLLQSQEFIRSLIARIQNDVQLVNSMSLKPDFKWPSNLTAFAGESDKIAPADRVNEWSHHVGGQYNFKSFSGGHMFISAHTDEILELVGQVLNVYLNIRKAG